jgi:GTP cyclohydrolase-4
MNGENVYIALGSNLGDRRANLIDAISQLRQKVSVEQISSVYETEPAYVTEQPRFYNMVLRGRTGLPPEELLRFLKSIERRMGRQRTLRYGPRPIDLDILAFGALQLETPDLTIPHPRIPERDFVLAPFTEIAPDLELPGAQRSIAAMYQQLAGSGYGKVVQVMQKLIIPLGRDVQAERPSVHLSLTHAGVSGIKRIVRLIGEERDDLFYAEMDLAVELGPEQKGAHLSRFSDALGEIIDQISAERLPTLELLAERVAAEVLHEQGTIRSDVQVRARFPQERFAPVSGKLTQEIYTLIGIAAATKERVVHLVGVEAEGTMASPSAQEMIADQARDRLLEAGFSVEQAERVLEIVPLATHNQRGRGTLIVGTDQPVRAEDLVHIVEGAMSSENYDLLKRPDELFVVAKAHRHPRFVEDAVREIILGLIELYPTLPDDTFVLARQLNLETVHKHDVYAERTGTLGELRHELTNGGYITPHPTLDSWLRERLNLAGEG